MIIEIETLSKAPIYEQLREQVLLGIASKKIARGEALPSVRRLAADLGINLHTVNKAYAILCEEGYIVMDRRKGALVAQTVGGGEEFKGKLAYQLRLSAAEAVCRNISENEFKRICVDCYRNAQSESEIGEMSCQK
ncbi:MAG: GntR family transcriptional regulator [Dehalococcoidia bacterium]|nr:GntR family transcriptional regulator [Dehalococcoidia bacterium]